jgi:hypothetical protein
MLHQPLLIVNDTLHLAVGSTSISIGSLNVVWRRR